MGLDVYLYDKATHEQNRQHDREWNALYESRERGEITEAEYENQCEVITQYASSEDEPSAVNPAHLFNRRYLRSSYNEGGFNSIAKNIAGHDLYWIFEPLGVEFDGWDGLLSPGHIEALRKCQARAEQVAREIGAWDRLQVTEFSGPLLGSAGHLWKAYPSKEEVLAWGREELARVRGGVDGGGYSTAKGSVFPSGFELLAVTMGKPEFGFRGESTTCYAVYRADEDSVEHYSQSALITAEFCQEAIALIERDGFRSDELERLTWT